MTGLDIAIRITSNRLKLKSQNLGKDGNASDVE